MTKLTISGMHCNACVSLINMEIEELGLDDKVESLDLNDDMTGELVLSEIGEAELSQIKSAINNMDQYNVEE